MPIDITIIKSPDNVNNSRSCQTFSESGGTIGRGPDNTWVLEDPDKYMSSRHTEVGYKNGQYILIDLSTNGTFVNGSGEPLGHGNTVNLKEGDRFAISDYEFVVNIRDLGQNSDSLFSPLQESGPFSGSELFAQNNDQNMNFNLQQNDDPFGMPLSDPSPSLNVMDGINQAETDPLAALDKAGNGMLSEFNNDPFASGSYGDNVSSINDSVAWPQSKAESGYIPDDWNDDLAANSASQQAEPEVRNDVPANSFSNFEALSRLENEYLALENENKELMTEIARLRHYMNNSSKNENPEQTSGRAYSIQDQTLMESMGLSKWNLDKQKTVQISSTVGSLVRESIEGMMRVLSFRKKIKEEFRINVTTIQPVENNPLKFSANIDDALENMFIKNNKAYKEPIAAVREGFQGIADHQVAVLAGIQAAFRGMLDRFDPETLEKRFEKYNKSGLIQFGQKGKNWESYKEFHNELVNNMDNSFQHLFGYDFVQAYEDQMQRLVIARKANKSKKSR